MHDFYSGIDEGDGGGGDDDIFDGGGNVTFPPDFSPRRKMQITSLKWKLEW